MTFASRTKQTGAINHQHGNRSNGFEGEAESTAAASYHWITSP